MARIDPRTNRVLARVHVGADPDDLVACGGLIWTTDLHGPNLIAVDPRTNKVARRVRVGVGSKGLACGRSLWTGNYDTGEVMRVSLRTFAVTGRAPVGSGPRAVALTPGSVWVANQLSGTLSRFPLEG
jgi:DNA-binding beta-propeller fold protein YncE